MRVESANAYIANAHPGCLHDFIFLVCGTCGQATHIDDDTLSETVRTIARNNGFIPERPVMEVLGRCAQCADRKSGDEEQSVSVRVDLGGRRMIKKKHNKDINYDLIQ